MAVRLLSEALSCARVMAWVLRRCHCHLTVSSTHHLSHSPPCSLVHSPTATPAHLLAHSLANALLHTLTHPLARSIDFHLTPLPAHSTARSPTEMHAYSTAHSLAPRSPTPIACWDDDASEGELQTVVTTRESHVVCELGTHASCPQGNCGQITKYIHA